MRETPKARQAWNDYLAMGADRSLEKLAVHYCSTRPEYANSTPKTLRRLLVRWSAAHGWQARLAEIAEQERAAIVARGIAEKQNRIRTYDEIARGLQVVIAERAQDPTLQVVPGGRTGLLVRQVKLVKVYKSEPVEDGDGETLFSAKRDIEVEEFAVDTGLLKELREYNKQASIEMGQWVEKQEHAGEVLIREYGVPLDQV